VFVWNVFQSKPKIKVDLIFGLDGKGDKLRSGVYIFARNLSSHDVHLANFSILYPYRDVGLKERLIHVWKYKHMPRRIGWVTSSLSNYSIEDGCPICLEAASHIASSSLTQPLTRCWRMQLTGASLAACKISYGTTRIRAHSSTQKLSIRVTPNPSIERRLPAIRSRPLRRRSALM
jgi:hypothetical protein